MSSTSKRRARKTIAKQNTFYRVVPMEVTERDGVDEKGAYKEALIGDNPKTEIIDTPFDQCLVVTVPPTCSYEMARSIEQRMMDSLGKPVIVMTNNLVLCRVEGPLDPKEIEEALKGVENADPEKLAAALVNRAGVANAEARREAGEEDEASGDAVRSRPDPFAGALPDVEGEFTDDDAVTDPGLPTHVSGRFDTSSGPDLAKPEDD